MSEDAPVRTTRPRDHVVQVTLDRPDVMNAYDEPLLHAVVDALERADADDDVRAVVLHGSGDAFCAGVDLSNMPLTPEMDFVDYEAGLGLFQDVVRTLRTVSTPVVAAVDGYALGAGCDTALACDFRIVNDDAVVGETFVDVGFVPGDGGAYLLPRLVGEEAAKELIFTGRKLAGIEIVEWGLAREHVEGDVVDAALDFAVTLAESAPVAVGEGKRLVNESHDVDLETAFTHATRAQRVCAQTNDHAEAVDAFAENREPEFEGR